MLVNQGIIMLADLAQRPIFRQKKRKEVSQVKKRFFEVFKTFFFSHEHISLKFIFFPMTLVEVWSLAHLSEILTPHQTAKC